MLIVLIGGVWAIYNGSFMIMLSFTPLYLAAEGMAFEQAAFLVGLAPMCSLVAVPLGGVIADQIANGVVKLAPSVVNLIKTLTTKLSAGDETGAPEGVGQVIAQGEQLATAFKAFPQESFSFTDFSIDDTPMKSLGDQLQEGASLGESASSLSLGIAFGVNLWDRKQPISIDVTLNSEQGIQLDASIVAVKAVRSRRVLRFKFDSKGTWSVD